MVIKESLPPGALSKRTLPLSATLLNALDTVSREIENGRSTVPLRLITSPLQIIVSVPALVGGLVFAMLGEDVSLGQALPLEETKANTVFSETLPYVTPSRVVELAPVIEDQIGVPPD